MNSELKRRFDRAKIIESLKELHRQTHKNSNKIYTAAAEALEFVKLQYEADRILTEIYG